MTDPLALGQRIVAILETGARTATYKLATLTALIDHCVEHLPAGLDAPLRVPLPDLAHRVMEVYWRQVLPFEGNELRQSTQPVALILRAVKDLRRTAGFGAGGGSLDLAMIRVPAAYAAAVAEVGTTLVRQPLHRLQKLPGQGPGRSFLYDDSWMHDGVSRRLIEQHGDAVVLYPGVAAGLARLSGLLKPTLEILWVDDVRRMNRFLDSDVPDVAGHLFGRERISLAAAREGLKGAFGPRCFYCAARLPADNPVDHVLPWSRVGLDGLANLVLACAGCNGSKLHALPALELVDAALSRPRTTLEGVAGAIGWPTQFDRVASAARGLYRAQPADSPLWAGRGRTTYLDLSAPPGWLRTSSRR